ncbi:MAG: TetR/AcrR family transcriptional regulator [Eubacteriales bacterium]|nr:TetR/AcrR family transcriptional regulator [Eubacteriales bacterium]
MDLRVMRTRTNITNAFIELRSRKPIEKITVKELADAAFINKATFYQHYRDIYDLSESMETELINNIVRSIPHPDTLIDNPGRATLEISEAMMSQTVLLHTLFSDSRQSVMVDRLEQSIREQVLKKHPEYEHDLEKEILITFLIRGTFHAFLKHSPEHPLDTIRILAQYAEWASGH